MGNPFGNNFNTSLTETKRVSFYSLDIVYFNEELILEFSHSVDIDLIFDGEGSVLGEGVLLAD